MMKWRRVALVGLMAWGTGCGAESADTPDPLSEAGMAGAPVDDGHGRDGGEGGGGGKVNGPANPPAEQLVGHGFTVSSSLCPQALDRLGFDEGVANGLSSFFVREGAKGGLELITYTRAGGAPIVETHALEQDRGRWVAHDVVTCAWLYGYEDYETESYASASVSFDFEPAQDGELKEANVSATLPDGEVVTSTAVADREGPTVSEFAEAVGGRGFVDGYGSGYFGSFFVFSEPLASSAIEVRDAQGNAVAVDEYLTTDELVWGFSVRDVLSADATISGEVEDLSGNSSELAASYPGINVSIQDGDFESSGGLVNSDLWVGQGPQSCGEAGVFPSLAKLATLVDVPALAGKSSLFIPMDCSLFVRVQRATGADQLRFDVRRLEEAGADPLCGPGVSVCVSSLGSANDGVCSTLEPEWLVDEQYSSESVSVSLPSSLTFALPKSGDDLLVEIGSSWGLWVDSLRTQ